MCPIGSRRTVGVGRIRRTDPAHTMTSQQHCKQLVRARMARTGESYSTARDRVQGAEMDVSLVDPVVVDVHGRHGQTVAFTPDGTRILSGGQDARVAILDSATGDMEGEPTGHDKVVNAVAIGCWPAPGATETPSCGTPSGGKPVRELQTGEQANAPCFSRSGQLLAAAAKGRVVVWNHEPDDPVAATKLPISGVYALAFSPDAKRFAQTGADGKVRIWTLR